MKSKMILPRKFFQGKSILLSILILFWVAYVVSSLTQYWVQSNQYYEGELKRRRDVIDYQLELAQHFLLNGKAGALAVRLQKAREVGEFDFFVLLEDNELVDYFNQGAGPEGLLNIPSTSDFVIGQRITVKAHQIGNYKILLGIFSSREQFLWTQLRAVTVNLVVDIIIVTLLVFLIVFLFLKDILKITKILKNQTNEGRRTISEVKTLSKEAEVLFQATTGYELSEDQLKKDKKLLSFSLAPAIRNEIQLCQKVNSKKPPYNIPCTVGRIDLNGYTQLLLKNHPQILMPVLNQYFEAARDMMDRFKQGFIYQYVGDEIVFFFKESEAQDHKSFLRAMGAIRSIFEISKKMNLEKAIEDAKSGIFQKLEQSGEDCHGGVKAKASLALGELTFVSLDQGYAFSGVPLVETVRMLGNVQDKNQNTLIAYEKDIPMNFVLEFSEKKTVFKGFEKEADIIEIRSFKSLQKMIEERDQNQKEKFRHPVVPRSGASIHGDTENSQQICLEKTQDKNIPIERVFEENFIQWDDLIHFYRTDEDLLVWIELLSKCYREKNEKLFSQIVNGLSETSLLTQSPQVEKSVIRLIEMMILQDELAKSPSRYLALTMTLLNGLLHLSIVSQQLIDLIFEMRKADDPRVQANMILTGDFLNLEMPFLVETMFSANNRIAADALLVLGKKDFNEKIFRRIKDLLFSNNRLEKASALFVISTLIQHFYREDLVYLKTNQFLNTLAEDVKKFIEDKDEMVKNRAMKSMQVIESLGIYAN